MTKAKGSEGQLAAPQAVRLEWPRCRGCGVALAVGEVNCSRTCTVRVADWVRRDVLADRRLDLPPGDPRRADPSLGSRSQRGISGGRPSHKVYRKGPKPVRVWIQVSAELFAGASDRVREGQAATVPELLGRVLEAAWLTTS